MGSMEEKLKHSKRIRNKRKAKVRSVIAKELITSGRYKQRVIQDKRGKKIDLETYTHADLVRDIQEE